MTAARAGARRRPVGTAASGAVAGVTGDACTTPVRSGTMGRRAGAVPGRSSPVHRSAEGWTPVATSQQNPRRAEPVLITEAQVSQVDQHAARKKRYALTMLVRGLNRHRRG